jgi:hypothetical protein
MAVQPLPMEPSRLQINVLFMVEIIRLNMELCFRWNQERGR